MRRIILLMLASNSLSAFSSGLMSGPVNRSSQIRQVRDVAGQSQAIGRTQGAPIAPAAPTLKPGMTLAPGQTLPRGSLLNLSV